MPLRLLALLAFLSPLAAAEAPATLLAQPDKEVVSDALTKDAPAADWKVAKGKWERTADGIRVEELPADKHGAVSRVAQKLQVGETLLFFGCRRKDADFLYEDELMAFARDGTLSELQLAFSREKAQKVYVQHLIQAPKMAKRLWALLAERGAHVYVCGGTTMGQDVLKAFAAVCEKEGKKSAQAAVDFVKGLQQQGRYVQELWSA